MSESRQTGSRTVATHPSTVVRKYEQLIDNRLRPLIEPSLSESQSGLRPGRRLYKINIEDIIRHNIDPKDLYLKVGEDDIVKQYLTQTKKIQIGFTNLQVIPIAEAIFADDVENLQNSIDIWNETLKKKGVNVN
ncbi:hypothetical protein Trydic_g19289 [Trypoxylus dichotomus]